VAEPLCDAILSKIREQIERTDHLVALVSDEQLNWVPGVTGAWSTAMVMGHLVECLAGICAVLAAAHPDELLYFHKLRECQDPSADVSTARDRLTLYWRHIEEGFALLTDVELARRVPTVFVEEGQSILSLLLNNLEHLTNHKHQLFIYLKLMGVNVASRDLYHFASSRTATRS
jgi:hypothetical protein